MASDYQGPEKSEHKATDPHDGDLARVLGMCLYTLVFGIAAAAIFAIAVAGHWPERAGVFGGELLIGGAAAFLGAVVGFLFAVPRSRQEQTATSHAESPTASSRLSDYAANTNLEQISDWLTKIIVGVSLVELKSLPPRYGAVATSVAPLIGATAVARPAAMTVMTYSSAWGFFTAYLLTRLWLPKALTYAEREEQQRIQQVERDAQLNEIERKAYRYLYAPPPDGFKRAIDLIDSYSGRPGAARSGSLALYLAAANGQRHAWALAQKGGAQSRGDSAMVDQAETEAQNAKARAKDAVREALKRDPETKQILKRLYEGSDPNDNDLVTLKGDEELDALLGVSKSGNGS